MRAVTIKKALELACIRLQKIAELSAQPRIDPTLINELANRTLDQIQELLK